METRSHNPVETRSHSLAEAYAQTLLELAEAMPNLVVLNADVSRSTRTELFARRHPDRFFNMGIAEQNMVSFAAGLALAGFVPFATSFATFISLRAAEQIRQSVAYPGLPVKLVASHAGLTAAADGATHQGTEDIAVMCALPNMTVLAPADAAECRELVRAAASLAGPCYIRLPRGSFPSLDQPGRFQVGRLRELRAGGDVLVLATGDMVWQSLQAAGILEGEGLQACVCNVSTLKPLDSAGVLRLAGLTGAVVTAEDHTLEGGLGSRVSSLLAAGRPVPVEMVGIGDRFGESGGYTELLAVHRMSPGDIADAARRAVGRKAARSGPPAS